MPNQIRPDDHNASDWFRAKYSATGIGIIFIYDERQSFWK
mgnify:CR=1 FL=1